MIFLILVGITGIAILMVFYFPQKEKPDENEADEVDV